MMRFAVRSTVTALFLAFAGFVPAFAQESLSVTLTPPLFQLTINPGETWTSEVKVVNNNSYEVTYQAQVVDFEPQGEDGQGTFVPLMESLSTEPKRTDSLASWIQIPKEPITVPAGQSANVQFTVHVPENADPGGHYAAIMVGPYNGIDPERGSHMKVSSFVTSLLFVRIKGDIVENGRIREFTTDDTLYQRPEANFVLRFENLGNTHLRPQGTITLYNMWGKERGQVLINEKSNFGNVLPRSIRRFQFSWSGAYNLFDIGRYSAIVSLAYGEDGRQSTSATTYFWVVPVVPVILTLGSLLLILLAFTWFIRRYIRRAIAIERMHRGLTEHPDVPERSASPEPATIATLRTLVEPLKQGVVDLRSVSSGAVPPPLETPDYVQPLTIGGFMRKYRLFFAFVAMIISLSVGIGLYFHTVLVPNRTYEIQEVTQKDEQAAQQSSAQ